MARRRFQLTDDQARELTQVYMGCKDGPTRTRYQAARLYGTGYPVQEVMDITGCSRTSLMEWCRTYRAKGAAGLVDKRVGGNRARLTSTQMEDVKVRLHQYTPADVLGPLAASPDGRFWRVEDLHDAIARWYGVIYRSRSSYHQIFDRCGFSYQRAEKRYKSRSEIRIAEFEAQVEKN